MSGGWDPSHLSFQGPYIYNSDAPQENVWELGHLNGAHYKALSESEYKWLRLMPAGDAIRIRRHAIQRVDEVRAAGETSITLRVGDMHDALYTSGSSSVLDICQVL